MDHKPLAGKTALVTGAARNIGRAPPYAAILSPARSLKLAI